MARYFLHLAYLGTAYAGWQRQPKVMSVQQVLEEGLSDVYNRPVYLHGCGRTDAGVHASNYYAHFDLPDERADWDKKTILNRRLPDDISIHRIIPVSPTANAQHDARQRTYAYTGRLLKNAVQHQRSGLFHVQQVDWGRMTAAAERIPLADDFRLLCKTPDRHKHTRCTVTSALLVPGNDGVSFEFTITANRFLRGMIRIIVDKLVQVGTGKLSPTAFDDLLFGRQATKHLNLAPPEGLCLTNVVYPYVTP
jgi:tRNA pseudouridine38-40 synthase